MGPCLALIIATQVASSTVATGTVAPQLVPPRPLASTTVAYPEGAASHDATVLVRVKIRVNEVGEVVRVDLIAGAGPPFDGAVMNRATHFRFEPATYGGAKVAVDIDFTQRFEPPPKLEVRSATAGPVLDAILAGRLEEKGTRKRLAFATVRVTVDGRAFEAESSSEGEFEVAIVAGRVSVRVEAFGYQPYLQQELLVRGERLYVGYLVEKSNYNPYEIVVVGKAERQEIARTVLRGREIQQIPGTFGDPFRVVHTMPGVSQMMSLLPFPIVRGSSPGNTGFLLDGERVPLLFHLLAGPSVVHPEFIDEIEFFPGVFSVEHGRYTGGIVNGRTRAAGVDEKRIDIDLNFVQAGAFVRWPIGPVRTSVAGRIGYPGLLISLASPDTSLNYYDYQARVDVGPKDATWTLFAFGAGDSFSAASQEVDTNDPDREQPTETQLRLQFHRVDARYVRKSAGALDTYQLSVGYDETFTGDVRIYGWQVSPRATWLRALSDTIETRMGIEAFGRRSQLEGNADDMFDDELENPIDDLFGATLLSEVLWRPHTKVLVRPGVRVDLYDNTNVINISVDPRLLWRWKLSDDDLYLKGGVGIYHQPPRLFIPLPGLDQLAFEQGLLRSLQSSAGVEVPLPYGFSVDVQGYFSYMDPILFDIQVNDEASDLRGVPSDGDGQNNVFLNPARGRSYGMELLLRRRSTTGVFGWLSYTLSRSERRRDDAWVPFDFDRTHIVSVVTGIPLPRNWSLGLRVQAQSGRPVSTTGGYNAARVADYVRFDIRVDKRAVWNDWLLEFYVDISNVVLSPEEIDTGNQFRYVLPTVGFRAIL